MRRAGSITKNPKSFNPATNPENLLKRRNHVLALMRNQGILPMKSALLHRRNPSPSAESKSATEKVTQYFPQLLFCTTLCLSDVTQAIMEQESCTRAEAQDKIFSDGLRIYSTLDQKAQSAMEQVMLNEDTGDGELFPALWHEEEVSSSIPADSEIYL